jgi:hypothetical protein
MSNFLIKFHMRNNDSLIIAIKLKLNINDMQSPFHYFTLYKKLSIPSQKVHIFPITTHHFRTLYDASALLPQYKFLRPPCYYRVREIIY